MSSFYTSMGRRSVIMSGITKHSRELTLLLRDLKKDLNRKFIMSIKHLQTIPNTIYRDSEFYNENIRNNDFADVINKFIASRTSKEFRNALESGMGIKILQRIIRNRMWEFLRGRLRQFHLHGLQHFLGNDFDDIDDEDMDDDANAENDEMSDCESPPVSPKPGTKQVTKSNGSPQPPSPPHRTRATTLKATQSSSPSTGNRNGVANTVQPAASNTNQRFTSKSKSPRGPNNNTPPDSPRTNEKPSTEPKRKQQGKAKSLPSEEPTTQNASEKLMLLVTFDSAPEYRFDITNTNELRLVGSDQIFTPPSTGSTSMLIGSYNLAGLVALSGCAFKSILMLTTRQRVSLMFSTEGDEFFSVAAPYVDRNTRFYATAIDLSFASETVLTPERLQRRFHMFLCMLSAYAFKNAPKKFIPLLKSTFAIDIPDLTRDALIAAISELPFATIRESCYKFVHNAASMFDLQVMPSFTLMNARSGAIEEVQPSQNDYEKTLMHIGVNLLAPEDAHNAAYPMTEALFQRVVLLKESAVSSTKQFRELFNDVSALFN